MGLKDRINDDLKTAMKARNQEVTGVLRMILSEIKYAAAQTNVHAELDEATLEKIVTSYHKRLTKSLEEYPQGDARTKIEGEIKIVEAYLPKKAGPDEVAKAIEEVLASSADRQFGTLMKAVMARLGGAGDGKLVSELLKKKLS